MSDTFWIALITGIPSILISIATLIQSIKNNGKIVNLEKVVDGKFGELLLVAQQSSETKGRIDAITEAAKTRVISDRRSRNSSKVVEPGPIADKLLTKIERNTEETAETLKEIKKK